MTARRRLVATLAAAGVATGLLAGCGLKLEQLPSPKGVSGATYHVTAQFGDVSNLVEGAKVKLQGVVVGDVTSIKTRQFLADVTMEISKKFVLARTSTFQVRFNTPLGENFIAVTSPAVTGNDVLADGTTVPVAQTGEAPGIEDTFAAVSLLLNGGGLDKLHIIANELDAALKGRAGQVRDSLVQLHTVISNFVANNADFDKALDGLAAMSSSLARGDSLVAKALAQFPTTFATLATDTGQIRQLLDKVATLGDTVQGLLNRSESSLVADVQSLRPTLDSLTATQSNLIPSFDALIRFGQLFDRATPGDYVNINATIQFLLDSGAQRPPAGGTIHPGSEPTVTAASTSSADAVASLVGGGR
jgi:phospholipid/cholesterol/gamma-HCH transport system substrate-binding protein